MKVLSRIFDLPLIGRFALALVPDKGGAALFFPGGLSFHSNLKAGIVRCGCGDPDSHNGVRGPRRHCPTPMRVDEMDFGSGVVTTAGVAFMANDFANISAGTNEITNMNYHDSGVGVVAAAIGDTILGTQSGPTTRAAGTQTSPAGGQYRSVGTISYTTSLAITEWGLFNQSAQGGTLWDRKVFSAINVANGDSIQFTYTLTVNSGG